ncbi:hypothetical protein BDQ17DRAFT_242521 [Cyathus striatus]|nr:hypothetical protein BDQ17DRAFT_242521 [Cyathus striatus]
MMTLLMYLPYSTSCNCRVSKTVIHFLFSYLCHCLYFLLRYRLHLPRLFIDSLLTTFIILTLLTSGVRFSPCSA